MGGGGVEFEQATPLGLTSLVWWHFTQYTPGHLISPGAFNIQGGGGFLHREFFAREILHWVYFAQWPEI